MHAEDIDPDGSKELAMNRLRRFARVPAVVLPLCLLAAGGCGKKIWVSQYPAFYRPGLRTIVVAPFTNATNHRAARRVITEKVASALTANATYEVLRHSDLAMAADGAELRAAEGNPAALVKLLQKRGRAQAILTGSVTQYVSTQDRNWRQKPVYDDDDRRRKSDRKHKRKISHYVGYTHVRNSATVDATARLIRIADGTTIHATPPGSAKTTVTSETSGDGNVSPQRSPHECLASAGDQCVAKLLEEFAVIRKQISVERDALRTAAEMRGGEWEGGKSFRRTDPKVVVVVKLPIECDRNHFRITIVHEGSGREVAAWDFTWLRAWTCEAGKPFGFSVRELAETSGPGTYVAKLYSGSEAVLDTEFKIKD